MGENDEFTTVSQLEGMVEKMRRNGRSGRVDIEVVPNVGHFQLESPSYDSLVSKLILDWLEHHALE
jgi:pimeloyl-ACP methyl ester carboxylesterase